MAHLGTKTSDEQLSFDKYVKNNPKWSSGMNFFIEHGVNQAPIVDIKENKPIETGNTVSGGQTIHIMSKSVKMMGRSRYVKIRLAGGSGVQGYLNISHIRKPTREQAALTRPGLGVLRRTLLYDDQPSEGSNHQE